MYDMHEGLERLSQLFPSRESYLLFKIEWFAQHPDTTFDVTFLNREPLLNTTFSKGFIRNLTAALMYGSTQRLDKTLSRVEFADGTRVNWLTIWTLNYMPSDLDTTTVDLSKGDEVAGPNGETIREMIRHTYRCKSRAEEDFFLGRWIAS
jgi:hypothetical protein